MTELFRCSGDTFGSSRLTPRPRADACQILVNTVAETMSSLGPQGVDHREGAAG